MTEENESKTPGPSVDSHDPNKVVSAFNSEDVRQDGPMREVRGSSTNERDVDLETGQQPLEKSRTATSDTSQRDPKLVYLSCLPFFAVMPAK
jgi:hypothetical protein